MVISLIIPIYNESAAIDSMLAQLRDLSGKWQILFADGGSTDDTVARIGNDYCVIACPKGRAAQMNYAAEKALGDVLWFVHCDSIIPRDAYERICEAVSSGGQWGCFRIAFDYGGLFMAYNTYSSNRRAARGIAFGDQGIFVKRELFCRMGGFPSLPIMEDYQFSLNMRERGIPITQLSSSIVTSGRRYRTGHPVLIALRMVYLRCLYRRGVDINEIARRYRDIR